MADALAAAYDLHRNRDPAAFGATLLRALSRAVDCDGAVLVAADPGPAGVRIEAWPATALDGIDLAKAARLHATEHPYVARWNASRAVVALRLSDLVSRERFAATRLYRELYGPCGVEHQLLMLLASPDRAWRIVALHRRARDFTREECATLEALWPHVTLAQRSLRRERRGHGPTLAPEPADSAGVIVIRSDASVTLCSGQARLWLADWFGGRRVGRLELPQALREWAARRIDEEGVGRRLRATRPDSFIVTRGEECLVANLVVDHGTGLHLMRLEKIALSAPAASLQAMGLTVRESEVLCWVAQGKTNREVGLILGASARTVQKHLEHIFQKIGVESRTAAILKAWQVGRTAALR